MLHIQTYSGLDHNTENGDTQEYSSHSWSYLSLSCNSKLKRPLCTGLAHVASTCMKFWIRSFRFYSPGILLIYIDVNARPHWTRAVATFLQQNIITMLPWSFMRQDLDLLAHIWDILVLTPTSKTALSSAENDKYICIQRLPGCMRRGLRLSSG